MAPLVAETTAFEPTVEDDVSAVKKSRAASPAPKTSKGKEEKEAGKVASPSAQKASKVEKSSETVKTEKVEKSKIRFGISAAVGIAALLAVIVALCFFVPAPLNLTLTSSYLIGGISLVAVALTTGTAVAVKKFKLKLPSVGKKQS
mmetsp:Transcript_71306/g.87470  ORF Transcript_71306/g.87470 Transcript_71306/m.87470 type:complete len:146 (-) Transcript_71306:270-707(-)